MKIAALLTKFVSLFPSTFYTCFLGIFLFWNIGFPTQSIEAQEKSSYRPILPSEKGADSLISEVAGKYFEDVKQLPKPYHNELKEVYNNRSTDLQKKLKRGDFYLEGEINDYFQHIFQTILESNPDIEQDGLRILVSRYTFPNAFCMGEGTLVFNLDLLRHLKNESQIAFILCHELAHQTLNHVNHSIEKRTSFIHSKELKRELKRISKSEYNVNSKMTTLLKTVVFSDRRHSREHEAEADALAIEYMSNTPYDMSQALTCLAILDKVDEEEVENSLDLKAIFHSPNFPFKDKWTAEETTLFGSFKKDEEEWDADSLKTHPDCEKRIKLLQEAYDIESTSKEKILFLQDEKSFHSLVFTSRFERVANAYFFEAVDKSLYTSLLLLKEYPTDAWLHSMVGKNLHAIYTAQKNYALSDVLSKSAPWQPQGYQGFLDFLWKLRLSEIARVGYHYLDDKKNQFAGNEAFDQALINAKELIEK